MRKVTVLLCLVSLLGCFALTGCCGAFERDEAGKVPAQAFVDSVRTANAVSGPINPWAIPTEAVLGAVSLVIGAYAASQHKQKITVGKKYKAHKRGVEAAMREEDPRNADNLYNKIGEERKILNI